METTFARYLMLNGPVERRVNKRISVNFLPLQLRLDFDSFTITGPSTLTTSVTRRRAKSGEIIYDVI